MFLHLFAQTPGWFAAGAAALRMGGSIARMASDGVTLAALAILVLEIALAARGDPGPLLHRGISHARQIARHLRERPTASGRFLKVART